MQHVRINAYCLAGGVYRTRSEAALEQLDSGCTAVLLAKIGMVKHKKHQMERAGYNSR